MSTDRTTEILNYLSAISREVGELKSQVGELRSEVGELRSEVGELKSEVGELRKEMNKRLDRIEGMLLTMRADVSELEDRVTVLEGKLH